MNHTFQRWPARLAAVLWWAVFAEAALAQSIGAAEEAAIKAAAARVADSVVQIRTIGGLDTIGGTLRADGPTSGLVISPDGFIITSAFNFIEEPASILVTLASGRQIPAKHVATDHSRKVVLLKVDESGPLEVADVAPASEFRVGQWAISVGRAFRPDQVNITVGIVSALDRMHGKALQTDAAVSTANYGGPLVDIRGRVIGIVVPMAPQSTSEVAGVEWYDSGIGFAISLDELSPAIERLKQGQNLRPGILGIGMGGKNPHSEAAELAAVRPDSPAGLAGLRKGDRIVEIDGQRIESQTDLRFALGTKYGGDSVTVVAMRGDERLERTIELAEELPAFRHAFLGILPRRDLEVHDLAPRSGEGDSDSAGDDTADGNGSDQGDPNGGSPGADTDAKEEVTHARGVTVRMVYPGSGAEIAGIRAGDRIVRIGDSEVATIASAIAAMNNVAAGANLKVHVARDGQSDGPMELDVVPGRLPTGIPGELPSNEDANGTSGAAAAARRDGESVDLKLPEFKQNTKIYVPPQQDATMPLGVVLWIHAPGQSDPDAIISEWKAICDRDEILLVVPTATDPARWERTEAEFLRRLLERVHAEYSVDPRRVVVHGQAGGGGLAYLLALAGRDLVSGVSTLEAPLPRQIRVPENEPMQRLAVLSAHATSGERAFLIAQGLKKLAEGGYPVTAIVLGDSDAELSAESREEMARWIDSLDRF